MTQEDIIRMAREAGLSNDFGRFGYPYFPELERFAALVAEAATEAANARATSSWTLMCKKMVAAENEACANVCEESNDIGSSYGLAQAIRARGNT
jgi:hypothetical protein